MLCLFFAGLRAIAPSRITLKRLNEIDKQE